MIFPNWKKYRPRWFVTELSDKVKRVVHKVYWRKPAKVHSVLKTPNGYPDSVTVRAKDGYHTIPIPVGSPTPSPALGDRWILTTCSGKVVGLTFQAHEGYLMNEFL